MIKKRKKSRRSIYGIMGALMLITAVGSVAAIESKPYKAPELRLLQGAEDYDLTEGIEYNQKKYELAVADTGDFDIQVLGKYEVQYSLTPIEKEELPGNGSGASGSGSHKPDAGIEGKPGPGSGEAPDAGKGEPGPGTGEAPDAGIGEPGPGTGEAPDAGKGEPGPGSGEAPDAGIGEPGPGSGDTPDAGSEGAQEGSGDLTGATTDGASGRSSAESMSAKAGTSTLRVLASRFTGSVYAAEIGEGKEALETESPEAESKETENPETGNPEIENQETGSPETGSPETEIPETENSETRNPEPENPDQATPGVETPEPGVSEPELPQPESPQPELPDSGKLDDLEDGSLDEADRIIYFTRVVRVVSSLDAANIEYDEAILKLQADVKLYDLVIRKEGELSKESEMNPEPEGSEAFKEESPESESSQEETSKGETTKEELPQEESPQVEPSMEETLKEDGSGEESKTESGAEAAGEESSATEESPATEESSAEETSWQEEYDGITETGIEYKLELREPELLIKDAFVADADGNKIKKAKITIKDDSGLKAAVAVGVNEKGAPAVLGLIPGFYTIELQATDPDTEEIITCERTIEIVAPQCVVFDAPVLYIGTKNTSYDLTSRMLARDENGGPVEPIYVLNEEELLAAREEVQVKATPSNAEGSTEETETGETETGETETEETVTEVRLKKGTYHVTLGAKHPVSGDEFTVEREVRVVDGYYIYAPTLEIAAGSTDYDLLQGVEVKNDEGTTAAVEVKIKDASELLRAAEEFETMSAESTEDENNFAADTVTMYSENSADEKALSGNPALKEGSYSITLMANDPNTGEEMITERSIEVRAGQNYFLYLKSFKDKYNSSPLNYGLTMPDYDYNGGVYSRDGGVYSGTINGKYYNTGVYAYKINEAKLHSLPVKGGYRETFWSNSSNGRGSNWELKSSTQGNWQNSFGRGDGFRKNYYSGKVEYEPDVSVSTVWPLEVGFFKQFNEMFNPDGTSKYFSDWHGYRSLRVTGDESGYGYQNLAYTTRTDSDYGGANNPILIPQGEYALQNFTLSSSKDTEDTPFMNLNFKLKHKDSYLCLDSIRVPNHDTKAGIGLYRTSGAQRPKSGTIYVRGDGGSDTQGVTIRNNFGDVLQNDNPDLIPSKACPNYVIENVGSVNIESVYGFTSAFMLNNVGHTSFWTHGKANNVQSMIVRNDRQLSLYGGGELNVQKAVAPLSADNDNSNKGVIKAGILALYSTYDESGNIDKKGDIKIYKPDIRTSEEPLITLAQYMRSNGNVIKAAKQGDAPFGPGETFAYTTSDKDVLDATDFYVTNPDQKTKGNRIYFTSTEGGKKIVTTQFDKAPAPICVQNDDNVSDKNYFETYAEAINSLTNSSGKYTITNLLEREFTTEDATALEGFNNQNVELTFSSGTRDDGIDGGRYRVRLRIRYLNLPPKSKFTFKNILLKYAQGDNGKKISIMKNGGELLIDENVSFIGPGADQKENETAYPYVFGGSVNKDCRDDAVITINSGTFTSVFGGINGTGDHYGAATITISGTATIYETLSCGNFSTKVRPTGKKESTITINTALNLKNIYSYDKLTIAATGDDKAVTVTNEFNSEDTPGYAGDTILEGGSHLQLHTFEIKKMGRLRLAEKAEQNATLFFTRPTPSTVDASTEGVLTLTKPDPLYIKDPKRNTKAQIEVGYSNKNPDYNDVAIYLRGATSEDEVSIEPLEDGFVNRAGEHKDRSGYYIAMIAQPSKKTIMLVRKSVGLSIKQGDGTYSTPTTYATLKLALDALNANEGTSQGSSYRINVFADGYSFSSADKTAMESMKTTTAKEILWTSKVDAYGADFMKAKTVSPNGDLTFFGEKSIVKDMTLNFTAQNSIYADGKPLEISTGVNITGTKPDLYGGSNAQPFTGDTSLVVLSGEFRNIYAGSNGENVTGNTSLSMRGGLATSVYGGGNGGTVTGDSTVSMEVPNKAAEGGNTGKTEFTFTDISGEGTVKDGALTQSVNGTKTVSVVPKDKNTDLKVHVSNLTGFDDLTLGDATGKITYANQQFRIKTRFDSSLTDVGTNRSDNVHLNCTALVLECGSGHIGNLNTQNVCALVIKRENDVTAFNEVTRPLLIDGRVTVSYTDNTSPEGVTRVYDKIKLRYVDQNNSADGDVMVTYSKTTNTAETEAIFYEDGTNGNLPTLKMDREDGTSDIIFSSKKAHTIEGEVIYPEDSRIEDASKPGVGINKVIVVNYDPKNEHEVAGGYVVKIPKDKITEKKYTENWMKTDGTFEQQEGVEMIPLTFKGTGVGKGSKGTTDTPVLIEENCFYVAHVACKNGDKSSLLLDVTAPRQSKTSGDAFGDYEGDGVNGTYHMHGDSSDYNITDKNLLPNAPSDSPSLGTKLTYIPHGVKLAAWSFGDADGNAEFEKAVAKADFGVDGNNVPEGLHRINITPAASAAACDIDFDISQKDVETAIAAGKKYLVVYVKDKVNNTAKYIIPMSDSMIDVKVPTRVSLVALKKSGTDLGADACKLLAPTCYIVNYGKRQVKAEVALFNKDDSQLLKLVEGDDAKTYAADQIALYLKSTGSGLASNAGDTNVDTKFNLRNVLSIKDETGKRAYLGTLEPKSDDKRTLDFTFGAYYDPVKIQEIDGWLNNTMSYHFSVVKTVAPGQDPNAPAP